MIKPYEDEETMYLHAESRGDQENDLAASRGIANGIAIAVIFWAVAYGVWKWWTK